jgi:hypothetical protein
MPIKAPLALLTHVLVKSVPALAVGFGSTEIAWLAVLESPFAVIIQEYVVLELGLTKMALEVAPVDHKKVDPRILEFALSVSVLPAQT